MLTSAQSVVTYDFATKRVVPDRLMQSKHHRYRRAADAMIAVYRRSQGATRQSIHRRIESITDRLGDCPPRRTAAFCKLLDDRATYRKARGTAAALRRRLFTQAAELHPIVSRAESMFEWTLPRAQQELARRLGLSWEEIEASLFADVIELQSLQAFHPDETFSAADLLAAYNVAQTQAALYRAAKLTVWATQDLKLIVRQAKLAGLMHRITRLEDEQPGKQRAARGERGGPTYRFDFDGPASKLRRTWRYGVHFARMLPTLLTCRGWRLQAEILAPSQGRVQSPPLRMSLCPKDGLNVPDQQPSEFDSAAEQQLFEAWQRAAPPGWTLERESELLHCGQTVLTPDFVLRRADHPPIFVELLGFWTPEYLSDKFERLRRFSHHRWIVIAPHQQRHQVPDSLPVLEWNKKFDPHRLVQLAERLATDFSSTSFCDPA